MRQVNIPNLEKRIETGVLKINDDWCGVFIRGDDAFAYSHVISSILDKMETNGIEDVITKGYLFSLLKLLQDSNESKQ